MNILTRQMELRGRRPEHLPTTPSFSAIYKTISGTSYVFVVAEANTHDIVLRRGELDQNTVNFDAAQTVFDGTSASNRYTKPTIAISENGHLWFSAIKDIGAGVVERFQAHAGRSTNLAAGDLSVLNAAAAVGQGVKTLRDAVIVPQNGDSMYPVASTVGSDILGIRMTELSGPPPILEVTIRGLVLAQVTLVATYLHSQFPEAIFILEEIFRMPVALLRRIMLLGGTATNGIH